MNPSVSIIILNWNGKHHLDDCLKSLTKQTFKNFEIILVDNGSSDGSTNYIRKNFPNVNLISLPQNLGFSGGNNIGIKKAKGELIVLLNNDTETDPNWLMELTNEAKKSSSDIGSFASKIMHFNDRNKIDSAGDYHTIMGKTFKRGDGEQDSEKYMKKQAVFSACGGAAMYKKKILDEIGLFDEKFFSPAIHEDSDLGYRALLAGYKCLFIPTALVYHKVSATTGRLNDFVVYQSQKNSEIVYLKNTPVPLIIKYGILHLYINIKAIISLSLRGYAGSVIRAKWYVLKNIRQILHERKRIQTNKKISNKELRMILSPPSKFKCLKQLVHRFNKSI